jgi:hypothetical protein
MARPTKYTPDMPERLLEMASRGLIVQECCAELGISETAYARWCNPEFNQYQPEFAEAAEMAAALRAAYYMRIGRDNMVAHNEGPKLNTGAWVFSMKNIAGWKDKTELSGNAQEPLVILGDQGAGETQAGKEPEIDITEEDQQ